jgi:hypothetical protein
MNSAEQSVLIEITRSSEHREQFKTKTKYKDYFLKVRKCQKPGLQYLSKTKRKCKKCMKRRLTLSNPIFLPTAYSPALICFGRERGWCITCTVLKEKNMERERVQPALSIG